MTDAPTKSMDKIMALSKRRGFIFQASEIYGGINGFWDYGPLGAQLKKNLRDAWWQDVVMNPCGGRPGPFGEPVDIVPLDSTIIQHPKVWVASGHADTFNDPMVDCRETKARYRFDHVLVHVPADDAPTDKPLFAFVPDSPSEQKQAKKAQKAFGTTKVVPLSEIPKERWPRVLAPDAEKVGSLTEPRAFNLMFKTYVGATATEEDVAYLRPETAQGIFVQFKNVLDSTRVKVPFGIAQTGKAFRNEVTPRNFTFRSREFEQMEIEFFCHPEQAFEWYRFWRDTRMQWWQSIGLAGSNLQLREQDEGRAGALRQGRRRHERHRVQVPVHRSGFRRDRRRRSSRRFRPGHASEALRRPSSSTSTPNAGSSCRTARAKANVTCRT